jgi:hypothetical protein
MNDVQHNALNIMTLSNDYHYAESHHVQCLCAECYYAECRYTDFRGADVVVSPVSREVSQLKNKPKRLQSISCL